MEESGGAKIRLRVPPVTRTGCATTGAKNALIHPIEFRSIGFALQNLLAGGRRRGLSLQPWLNRLVLVVKVGHVDHQILDHEHVWQRRYHRIRPGRDLRKASQPILAVNVHRAWPADALPARPTESQRRVDLVLYLDQGVQHHRPTLLQINLVLLQLRLLRVVWAPPVNLELLNVRARRLLGIDLGSVGSCQSQLRRRGGRNLSYCSSEQTRRHRRKTNKQDDRRKEKTGKEKNCFNLMIIRVDRWVFGHLGEVMFGMTNLGMRT